METVTIRELRQNWPAVEKRLAAGGELSVTRDGVPVAQLTAPRPAAAKKMKKRFDPAAHLKLMEEIWGKRKLPFTSEELIEAERAKRVFGQKR